MHTAQPDTTQACVMLFMFCLLRLWVARRRQDGRMAGTKNCLHAGPGPRLVPQHMSMSTAMF